jgi:3-oxoacyl-[acyl-carrier-protein] synthase-3
LRSCLSINENVDRGEAFIRKIKFLGSGIYLPKQKLSAHELDKRLDLPIGTTEGISGVQNRHMISGEEGVTQMAAIAVREAVADAELRLNEIDLLVVASFSYDQPIPYKAALVQRELGLGHSGVPCFDIDATCLSFVVALDNLSYLIDSGRYKNVVIVSSESASAALNWKHLESAALFGDGAVAMVIGPSPEGEKSVLFASRLETYGKGAETCTLKGGGYKILPREFKSGHGHAPDKEDERFLFAMNGREAFKFTRQQLPDFVTDLLKSSRMHLSDFNLIIPHQASLSALNLLKRFLGIRDDQWVTTVQNYGNLIAASIPLSLHLAIKEEKVRRGDSVLLIGTSAGLSIGAVAFIY